MMAPGEHQNRRRISVVFGLVIALFLAVTGVQQHQQAQLHDQQREIARRSYESCTIRNDNVLRLNKSFALLATADGLAVPPPLSTVDCGAKP